MQRQTPRSGLVRVVNPGLKRGPHTPKNYQDKGKSPNIFQAFWQKFYQNSSNQMTLEFLLEFFQILQKIRNLLLLWQNSNQRNWQIPKKWMLALFLILMHFMFGTPQLLLSFRFSSKISGNSLYSLRIDIFHFGLPLLQEFWSELWKKFKLISDIDFFKKSSSAFGLPDPKSSQRRWAAEVVQPTHAAVAQSHMF